MSIAIEQTIQALQVVLQEIPAGTNLALLQLLWSMLNGSFLKSRGAIFPAMKMSGFDWLRNYKAQAITAEQVNRYDLVFLDPPFALALMHDMLSAVFDSQCLSSKAMIYVEQPQPLTDLVLPEGWTLHRSKKAGQVFYGLLSRVSLS